MLNQRQNQPARRRSRIAALLVVAASTTAAATTTAVYPSPSSAATKITKAKAAKATRKPSTTAAAVTPTTEQPRAKIVVGSVADPATLDPAAATFDLTYFDLSNAIYDTLMDAPLGATPTPGLASSVTESADRRTWTITLRSGITFHDGTPFNADAVKLNLERQRKSRLNAIFLAPVGAITVIDPLTVALNVDRPYASIPYLLGGTIGLMVSPKALQERGDQFGRNPGLAGTGPYILNEWVPGSHAVVVRNPNYWQAIKPRLEQIRFQVIPDDATRVAALESGELAAMAGGTNSRARLQRLEAAGFIATVTPAANAGTFLMNNAKPPFDDPRLRRAVWYAVDAAAVAVFAGDQNFAKQGNGIWPKGNPWYSPSEDRRFNKAEARRLVNDYIRDTGRDASFTLLVFSFSPGLLDVARLQAKNLQDAGFDVKLTVVPDPAAIIGAVFSGQCEASQWSTTVERDPDATAFPILASASPLNVSRYKNAEMDEALLEGRSAATAEGRKAAYAKVQQIFRRDLPFIVGSPNSQWFMFSSKLCGTWGSGAFPARTAGLGNC